MLELAADSLIPLVRNIQAKIKHYVYEQPQFYTMMALLCEHYGRYLTTNLEMDNYLDDFEKVGDPFCTHLVIYFSGKDARST